MPKIKTETMLSAQDAACLLGYDYQTLRCIIQQNELPPFLQQFCKAVKSSLDRECYTYMLPKYWVCMYAGINPDLPTEEIIKQIKAGKPPHINASDVMVGVAMKIQERK